MTGRSFFVATRSLLLPPLPVLLLLLEAISEGREGFGGENAPLIERPTFPTRDEKLPSAVAGFGGLPPPEAGGGGCCREDSKVGGCGDGEDGGEVRTRSFCSCGSSSCSCGCGPGEVFPNDRVGSDTRGGVVGAGIAHAFIISNRSGSTWPRHVLPAPPPLLLLLL